MNKKIKENMKSIVDNLIKSYEENYISESEFKCKTPSKVVITEITDKLMELIYPGFFGETSPDIETLPYYIGDIILSIQDKLTNQIALSLCRNECSLYSDDCKTEKSTLDKAEEICYKFFECLPKIREYCATDVTAAFEGDPAATSKDQIVSCYPGVFATGVYRLAHELLKLNTPYIPRIMAEYAHNETGIDIHPGATIGKYFFIDHGTGVVIGETTVIGDYVKIYQGVTLGATSTRGGQKLAGKKRHPTLEDYATIYSGATVLGGDTVIGKNVVIGGNAFVTNSVFKD